MESFENTPEEMAALELYHQLANLSDDNDRALLITLRMPNGRYVGDVWLSKREVEGMADVSRALNLVNGNDDQIAPPLPEVDSTDVTEMLTGFEKLLGGE